MLLGQKAIWAGDTRRILVSYRELLTQGVTLSSVSVTMNTVNPPTNPPGTTSIIGSGAQAPVLFEDHKGIIFYVTAGTFGPDPQPVPATGQPPNNIFTVNIQVTDSNGEVINDSLVFEVIDLTHS